MFVKVFQRHNTIMILTLKNSFLILLLALCGWVTMVSAQSSELTQTLSVSPTLFQMTANPSQAWVSEIRVSNVNDYPITVYPQVVNFAPSGESGQGNLIPIFTTETKGQTLAEWVTISSSSVVISPQQTVGIPFTVQVIGDPAPGGHYAAILVGTKPSENNGGAAQVQTAQFVTSLLFVRISGDVVEKGGIREFTTKNSLYSEPAIDFEIRFENTGNVHLQPQGDITITNMWGIKRGVIPINYQTHFGNVLPSSIRKFSFTWTGEKSSYDIGRFKAIATLGYGEDTKNFATSTTYFWVIPLKQISVIGLVLLLLFWFFSFAIKAYIRRMLMLAGVDPNIRHSIKQKNIYSNHNEVPAKTVITRRYQTVTGPVRFGISELIRNLKTASAPRDFISVLYRFVVRYKLFIFFVLLCVVMIMGARWFFGEINTKSRPYEVTINNPDASVTISSEEIVYKTLPNYIVTDDDIKVSNLPFTLEIINASGVPGLGAKNRKRLETLGYAVSTLITELERADTKTVVVFNPKNQEAAVTLSKTLYGALLSTDEKTAENTIKVYVGSEVEQ